MTAATPDRPVTPPAEARLRATAIGFGVLLALTVAELGVAVVLDLDRAARVTALCGLLIAKVGLVLTVFLRVGDRRRDPRLALAALFLAAGFAVVLMLEMAFRMRHR
jgi:heme/copper-type cytochrome/quinol oxidase subunit 4